MLCSICYDEEKETSYILEIVNEFEMLFPLCDECLVNYSKHEPVRLDGAIHGLPILDYKQLTEHEQSTVDNVLDSIGLSRESWYLAREAPSSSRK